VHRFVRRRTGDDALADDLTAVTFQRCWSALGKVRPDRSTLRPWLMRIAANEMSSHYRSEGRRHRRERLVDVRERPLRRTDHEPSIERDAELVAALSTLSERYQTVLALRFLADLTTEEAAEAMDMSRQHLAVLQHRALGALRRVMTPREEDDHVR
jgi:RNA polymerase sigma-70 factor (ECF subfamily)